MINEKNEQKESKEDYSYLKENLYNKLKSQILTESIKAGYEMMTQIIKDEKNLKTFINRELHGILVSSVQPLQYNKNQFDNEYKNFFLFPKKRNDILETSDFYFNKIYSNIIYGRNYVYKFRTINSEQWENHSLLTIRFIKLTPIIKNNINEHFLLNSLNSNDESILEKDFVDCVISLYSDISDNSTMKVNQYFYHLPENEFIRFYEVAGIFNKKLKNFIEKNLSMYLCNESILINRSLNQVFNYVINCKLFTNERFKIIKITRDSGSIEIIIETKDKYVPDSVYLSKFCIQSLSEISCFVLIMHMIDIRIIDLKTRFTNLKAGTMIALKTIKKNVENESIDEH